LTGKVSSTAPCGSADVGFLVDWATATFARLHASRNAMQNPRILHPPKPEILKPAANEKASLEIMTPVFRLVMVR